MLAVILSNSGGISNNELETKVALFQIFFCPSVICLIDMAPYMTFDDFLLARNIILRLDNRKWKKYSYTLPDMKSIQNLKWILANISVKQIFIGWNFLCLFYFHNDNKRIRRKCLFMQRTRFGHVDLHTVQELIHFKLFFPSSINTCIH